MITHIFLVAAVRWRRLGIVLVFLTMSIVLVIVAPSRVHIHTTTGPVLLHEYGFDSAATFLGVSEAEIGTKKIAVMDGSLWEWTGVRLDLAFIQSGVVQDKCNVMMGTNSGRLDHPFFCYQLHGHVALGKANTTQGSFAFLGSYGVPGGGKSPTHAPKQPAKAKRGYDRDIAWSQREIVYVEGSEEPVVHQNMSFEEFCNRNNSGEYLVVIASLQ